MNESLLFEKIGRLEMRREEQDRQYDSLLNLVRRLKASEVSLEAVQVDMAARSWQIVALKIAEPENGKPAEPVPAAS